MAYETFVNCDNCKARVQVPQPGALPIGWLILTQVAAGTMKGMEPQAKQTVFCSYKCAYKHVKGYLSKEEL